jgi:hypothetical protein
MVKDLVSIFGFDPLFGFNPTQGWNPSDQLITLYGIHIAAVYALVRIHEHPDAKRFALFIVFAGWLLPTLVPMTIAVEYAFRDKRYAFHTKITRRFLSPNHCKTPGHLYAAVIECQ